MTSFDQSLLLPVLRAGLNGLKLAVADSTCEKLWSFLAILSKWNKHYNLTAITDPTEMVYKHLLDSLSILPYLEGEQIIDVGSGAGLPGIPLALCLPEKNFTLLDSDGKRTRFLRHVQGSFALTNVRVIKSRAEDFHPDVLFDMVLTRAFSSLGEMLLKTKQLCAKEGWFLAMKGCYPEEEVKAIPEGFSVEKIVRLDVPGVEGERHLVVCGVG